MISNTYDEGRYWLKVARIARGRILSVHPSVNGFADESITLHMMPVYDGEIGLAPGQHWPEGWGREVRLVELPFPDGDYEERLGDLLALRVLHMLTMAYRSQWKGVAGDGTLWGGPGNVEVVEAWEAVNDHVLLLRERLRMTGRH